MFKARDISKNISIMHNVKQLLVIEIRFRVRFFFQVIMLVIKFQVTKVKRFSTAVCSLLSLSVRNLFSTTH